jgi:hypothetical protein
MPRHETTDDYIQYIEERLHFDPVFLRESINDGLWNYEYYEALRGLTNLGGLYEEEGGPPPTDPAVITALQLLQAATMRKQIGTGFSDKRKIIKELETDLIYIPSSPYCLAKCLAYCDNRIGGTRTTEQFIDLMKQHNHLDKEGGVSLHVVGKVLRYSFNLENLATCPVGIVTWRPSNRTWQLRQGTRTIVRFRIGYVPFKCISQEILEDMPNRGHYIVFKTAHYIDVASIPIQISIRTDLDLHEQISYRDFSPRYRPDYCIVWDLEAFRKRTPPEVGKFIEYGIGAMVLDIRGLHPGELVEERITNCFDQSYQEFVGPTSFTQFLLWANSLGMDNIQCFAHNSGYFDTLLLRQYQDPLIKYLDKLENGSKRVLCQKLQYAGGPVILFKDSCAFMNFSLDFLCKNFKTYYRKDTMQHATITEENYMERYDEWSPYLKMDVASLGEVIFRFEQEQWYTYGESILTNVTISSMANSLMRKSCYLKEVFVIKDLVAQAMIQQSCYGGRIFHTMTYPNSNLTRIAVYEVYKAHFKKSWESIKHNYIPFIEEHLNNYICMDANKLYLSAMHRGSFPVGYCTQHPNYSELKNELILGTFKGRAICDVTMIAPHLFMPTVPIRVPRLGNYFPIGQFRQTMTDIDIQEAIRHGYDLLEIHSVLYWKRHAKVFTDLTQRVFEVGNRYKEEGNAAAVTINKLNGNSFYGVNLKRPVDMEYSYKLDNTKPMEKAKVLSNGQIEYLYRVIPNMTCAPQIGSYILAYSRVIMNELLEALHAIDIPNVVSYGDTDSIYISEALMPIINPSGNPDNSLGGFKNDYDEGTLITDFRKLGPKRYSLQMRSALSNADLIKIYHLIHTPEFSKSDEEWFEDLRLPNICFTIGFTEFNKMMEDAVVGYYGPRTQLQTFMGTKGWYKHKMCGVYFMSERKRNLTDTLPLQDGMSIEKLPTDDEFFRQLDLVLDGRQDTIKWYQDVWRRKETGVFIYGRQMKELKNALPRRYFTPDGSSVPFYTETTAHQLGCTHPLPSQLVKLHLLERRDYTANKFVYDPFRLGKRFPPNTEALGPQAIVTSDPRLATSFITEGVKKTHKVYMTDCSEIKMAIKRFYVEDGQVYERYEIVDMTFAGPKHKTTNDSFNREELLEKYAYVMISNLPYLSNKLDLQDPKAQRFLENMLTALHNPSKFGPSTPTKDPLPSKTSKTTHYKNILSGKLNLEELSQWPQEIVTKFSALSPEKISLLKGKERKAFTLWLSHQYEKAGPSNYLAPVNIDSVIS